MIFPADYRERLLKQEKSRQYKAMLDEQIRQNNLYNQQVKSNKRTTRIRTQPIQLNYYHNRSYNEQRQLPHSSNFLPLINSNNVIDHNYKYTSRFQNPKKYTSQSYSKKYAARMNDEEDDHLEKCLEQCDQLIHGINRNFMNIQNHVRNNSFKRRGKDNKIQRGKIHSQFDMFNDKEASGRGYNDLSLNSIKKSRAFSVENDVGRNQMMNYNLLKSKQKSVLQLPSSSEYKGLTSPIQRDTQQSNYFKNINQKTKRKDLNNLQSPNIKSPSSKNKNTGMDFDTINSDQQNQFSASVDLDLGKSMISKMSESQILDSVKNQIDKKTIQEIKAHQEMKKKDTKLIEHLRKAKNRGSILFKKIQVFKKQRQELQSKANQQKDKSIEKDGVNAEKSRVASKNSNVSQGLDANKVSTKKIEVQLKKQDINYSSPKKEQLNTHSKILTTQVKATDKKQSRVNSQLSQKAN